MSRNQVLGSAALVLIIAGVFAFKLPAADEAALLPDGTEFKDKIVAVYLSNVSDYPGQYLEKVEFKRIGGRLMLVGTSPSSGLEHDWTANLKSAVAWDSVAGYFLMTKEDYKKAMDVLKELEEGA